jgi:hypothetical protein
MVSTGGRCISVGVSPPVRRPRPTDRTRRGSSPLPFAWPQEGDGNASETMTHIGSAAILRTATARLTAIGAIPGRGPRAPVGVRSCDRPPKHGALSGHHRPPDAACKRERPIAPWLHQRAVKPRHPARSLVGPVRRSGRTQDRFVPIALVLLQSFRAPMPRCNALLERDGRTYASVLRRARRRSVAAFAGSSCLISYQDPRKFGRVLLVNGVSVALDETTREVSERQVLPAGACARESSSSGR